MTTAAKSKLNHGLQPIKTFICEHCGEYFEYPARKCFYCPDCREWAYKERNRRSHEARAKRSLDKREQARQKYATMTPLARDVALAREAGMSYGQARATGVI